MTSTRCAVRLRADPRSSREKKRDRQRFIQLHNDYRTVCCGPLRVKRYRALGPLESGRRLSIQKTRRDRPPSWLPRPIGRLLSPALLRSADRTPREEQPHTPTTAKRPPAAAPIRNAGTERGQRTQRADSQLTRALLSTSSEEPAQNREQTARNTRPRCRLCEDNTKLTSSKQLNNKNETKRTAEQLSVKSNLSCFL